MNNIASIIVRFYNLSWDKRLIVLRVIFIYVQVSLIVYFLPVKKYFKAYFSNSPTLDRDLDLHQLQKEIRTIKRILRNCPIKISCLKESMVIKKYFRKQQILVPIFLGVCKRDDIKAHAWVINETSRGYNTLKEL